jgi:segregation and condensation protein A
MLDTERERSRMPAMEGKPTRQTEIEAEPELGMALAYQVKLDVFEGPLDLLLHLIRKNEVDIYNIPIALITEQYLATLDLMKTLNLDVAGEFLLMAATLAHIKSRMLLPPSEDEEEEEEDPRADLVRQLLEYQRFKEAAESLDARPQLYRDTFLRGADLSDVEVAPEEEPLAEVSVFALMEAFQRVWERAPSDMVHEITVEKITLRDKIHEVLERLETKEEMTFEELLTHETTRQGLVLVFLALLELARLRIVRIYQVLRYGAIRVRRAVSTLPEDREAIARRIDVEAQEAGVGEDATAARGGGPAGKGSGEEPTAGSEEDESAAAGGTKVAGEPSPADAAGSAEGSAEGAAEAGEMKGPGPTAEDDAPGGPDREEEG